MKQDSHKHSEYTNGIQPNPEENPHKTPKLRLNDILYFQFLPQ